MKKRILSMVLCICLVLSVCPALNLLPLTAAAADTTTYEFYDDTVNTDNFFTTNVDGGTNSATVTMNNGVERTFTKRYPLKSTSDTITLNSKDSGTLIIVWASSSSSAKKCTIDGTEYSLQGTTAVCQEIKLSASETNHVIAGKDNAVRIWYIAFTPDDASSGGDGGDTPACEHAETTTTTVDATCTVDGSTTVTCDSCGEIVSQTVITATGHNYVDGECTVCHAEQPTTTEQTHTFTPSVDVVAGADKDAIAAGTTYANGYFVIDGTVTQRVNSGVVTTVEVGKNNTGAIVFNVTGTATVTVLFSSTGGGNTSAVGILDANGNLMTNAEGITEVKGTDAQSLTYNLPAGTYRIVSPDSGYSRGARVHGITVVELLDGGDAPACEHENVEAHPATDPTCGVAGNSAYWSCECGKYFSDADATNEIEENSWVGAGAAATGEHTYDKTIANGKCTVCEEPCAHSYGTDDVCTICGMAKPACTHEWDTGTVKTPATCQTKGVTTYTCTLGCGATKDEEDIPVDSKAHTLNTATTIKVDPTCIANGHESTQCSACEEWISTVLAAGHNYDADGVCTICGAKNNTDYVHYFNDDNMTDVMVDAEKSFFAIKGALKNDPETIQYNNLSLYDCIKMNDKLNISFQVPANVAAEDDYDGVLILISTVRALGDGVFTQLTITETKADGTTNTVILTFPADGILVFNVNAGSSYTINKANVENNLYYIEYVPGYTLNSDSSDRVEGEGSYIVAENERTRVQYLSLAAAVADALAGDVINMLAESSEAVTVTVPLTIMKNGYQVTNVRREGCLSAKEDSTSIVFTGNAHTEGTPVIENEVAATETTDGSYDTVIYCSVCQAELSRVTTIVPATGGDDDTYVAMNVQTEVKYTSVSAALEAAENGQEVILLKSTSDKYVIIPVGVLLNLDAYTLTADYVVGFNGSLITADRYSESAAYGKLFVNEGIVLGETAFVADGREVLPLWDEEQGCYVFAKLGIWKEYENNDLIVGTDEVSGDPLIKFSFVYKAGADADAKYLEDNLGADDNQVKFVVRMTWTNEFGVASQDFVYNAVFVQTVANGGQYFTMSLTNYEELGIDLATLEVTALIISDTGVMAVGDTYKLQTP